MIGRDRITLRWTDADGDPVTVVTHGVVVTDEIDGRIAVGGPFSDMTRVVFYRVLLPRSLDLSNAQDVKLSFRDRTERRPETAIAPIFDARGRVHHFEAIVR